MIGTVAVVVETHDLAKGVLFGVILSDQRSERFSLERIDRNHDHHRDQRCHRDLRHVGAQVS
jgi:hypothetical protein